MTPARADAARLAPLSLAISIDPSTHHVVPSVPRLRSWFDLDSLRQLDITLSHEDPELNSAALECVAGLLRALPRPTQLETLSITNSSLATVDLIDIFAIHRLGLVIGRIQGLRTFSVMTNPVKAGRALHQLVQSLPDLSRLVTSDLVASLKGLSGGHAALRQIGLASVIGHVCARLDADSLRSDCDWCKLPRRGILQLLAVRNRFPALDTVVLQSSQQLPIAYDVASDGPVASPSSGAMYEPVSPLATYPRSCANSTSLLLMSSATSGVKSGTPRSTN